MNKKLLIGSAVALFVSACDADKITDANNNPNSPTNAPSSALFTNASRLSTRWVDGVGGTRYGFLPQHLAQVQYPDDDQYLSARLGPTAMNGLFNGSYSGEQQDLRLVRDRGIAATLPGLWAPAQILSLWEYGVMTDLYGDIPFRQALDPAVLRPAYDSQTVIYDSLFSQLAAASTALAAATNELGTGDPIYGGDPASWRRFANSLRLRHAMRLYNVDPTRAAAQAAAAIAAAGGLITTNAQNAAMTWPGDGTYDNPWANNFKSRDDHRISDRLLTVLSAASDPRLPILAMTSENDSASIPGKTLRYCPPPGTPPCYIGLANALTQATASPLLSYTSRPGAIWYPGVTAYGTFGGPGKSYPSYFMTAAEVSFLLAEAAERGVAGAGVAGTHYANGVTRHMEMMGVAAGSITTFLAGPGVFAGATTGARQTLIATQKWVAMMTDPLQAYFDVRRTCVPGIVQPGPNARFPQLPRRLQYANTESAVNSANRSAAVTRQFSTAGDVMTARIYIDPLGVLGVSGWQGSPTYVAGCSDRAS